MVSTNNKAKMKFLLSRIILCVASSSHRQRSYIITSSRYFEERKGGSTSSWLTPAGDEGVSPKGVLRMPSVRVFLLFREPTHTVRGLCQMGGVRIREETHA